jgi:hypothetical protein
MMELKDRYIIFLLLLIGLSGCQSTKSLATPIPTEIPTSTSAPAQTPLPRWVSYQVALSKALVNTENGVCEWKIYAYSGDQVYVWAICKVRGSIGTTVSVPAVLSLGEGGEIEEVIIPRDGTFYGDDIRALFPPDVQEQIFANDRTGLLDMEHLNARLTADGPPLIVAVGTPLP